MKEEKYSFSIVDLLVGMAILLILTGLFAPHFIAARGRNAQPAHPTATTQPAR